MAGALFAYLHYAAMVLIAVFLVIEYLACVPGLARAQIRRLARVDTMYLGAAVLALATGMARVIWFGKGAAFYLNNPAFYIKLALFVSVGLISIPPTLQYLRWMRALKSGEENVAADYQVLRARRYVLAELIVFAVIPLMATLIARGIGTPAVGN